MLELAGFVLCLLLCLAGAAWWLWYVAIRLEAVFAAARDELMAEVQDVCRGAVWEARHAEDEHESFV